MNSDGEVVDLIWGPDLTVEVADDTDWDVIVAPQPDGTQKITVVNTKKKEDTCN